MSSLKLFEMIDQLRQDILVSQAQMRGEGREPAFSLENVEIEAKFTVAGEGKAGIKFYVVTAGGSVKAEKVHSIKLTLKPTGDFEKVANTAVKPRPAPAPEKNPRK